MGMLPPKYSKGLEDLNKNESSGKMHQPPSEPISYRKKSDGKKKELEEDSSMFQISALRQSGGYIIFFLYKYLIGFWVL